MNITTEVIAKLFNNTKVEGKAHLAALIEDYQRIKRGLAED